MNRWRIIAIVTFLLPCICRGRDVDREKYVSRHAGLLAAKRLQWDLDDKKGKALLRFALILNPDNENAMLTEGLLEKERKPRPVKIKKTEADLAKLCVLRADELMKKKLPANDDLGPLCMLYLRIGETLQPLPDKGILMLQKLKQKGHDYALADLMAQDWDVAKSLAAKKDPKKADDEAADKAAAPRTLGVGEFEPSVKKLFGEHEDENARKADDNWSKIATRVHN